MPLCQSDDKVKICVLNPFFYPYKGGTEKVLFEVYRRLAKKNDITVVTSAPKNYRTDFEDRISGIKVIRLKSDFIYIPKAPMPFVFMHNLDEVLKKVDADLYHINNRFQYFYSTLKTIKDMDKKIAITIHNSSPKNIDATTDNFGYLYDYSWGKKLIHNSDIITGVSMDAIKMTVPKEDVRRSKVIYNGVDFKRFKPRGKNNKIVKKIKSEYYETGINVLNNGRLVTQKGQIYLMKAVSNLLKENYDIKLTLIGNGPLYNKFIRFAKMHGMYENFRIISGIPEEFLPYYYNAADVFVFPSLYEPAGMALLEAMSSEIPSMATRIGGIPEMMGSCGLYFPSENSQGIYSRLKKIIDNGFDKELLIKGRERMVKYHDWNKIAKEYEELFESNLRF